MFSPTLALQCDSVVSMTAHRFHFSALAFAIVTESGAYQWTIQEVRVMFRSCSISSTVAFLWIRVHYMACGLLLYMFAVLEDGKFIVSIYILHWFCNWNLVYRSFSHDLYMSTVIWCIWRVLCSIIIWVAWTAGNWRSEGSKSEKIQSTREN